MILEYDHYHTEVIKGYQIDRIIRQYFPDPKYKGVFFDVGAFDPVLISNSYHFERNGWNFCCFEANTDLN